MNFHWPSFLLGYAAGAGSVLVYDRLRPFLVQVGSFAFEAVDSLLARATMVQEDIEDVFAEARARARPAPAKSAAAHGGGSPPVNKGRTRRRAKV